MNLRELVDTVDVPPTRVAEEAWSRARARVVRRRAAAVACVGAVVVVLVVWSIAAPGTGPLPGPRNLQPAGPADPADITVSYPDWAALSVDTPTPGDDTPALSTDPVAYASLAINDQLDDTLVYVLGDDGGWRRVDVDGLVPSTDHGGAESNPVVRPTSLSEDGTQLALPQPDGLVVVDLTDGTSRRYDVPGLANAYVGWQDATHVLVTQDNRLSGQLVDLSDGSVTPSSRGRATRPLDDGTALTWDWGTPMRWEDGREVPSPANNSGGFYPQPPLVSGDVVVGLHGWNMFNGDGFDPALESLRRHSGVVAVDAADGQVLSFLQLSEGKGDSTSLLGWDGDLPVLGLVRMTDQQIRTYVVTWDYRAGTLQPLAVVPAWWVSWSAGP